MKKKVFILIASSLVVFMLIGAYAAEKAGIINLFDNAEKASNNQVSNKDNSAVTEPEYVVPEDVKAIVTKNVDTGHKRVFEKFIKEFHVPKEYVEKILQLEKEGYSLKDIMITYDFLEKNYGQFDEIEQILKRKSNGENLPDIFDEYIMKKPVITQKDFAEGEIDQLLKSHNIEIDDIMIADIISQETHKSFEEIIEPLKNGSNWQKVAVDVGALKCDGKINVTSASKDDIEEYAKQNSITKQQAAMYISIEEETDSTASTDSNSKGLLKSDKRRPTQKLVSHLENKYN